MASSASANSYHVRPQPTRQPTPFPNSGWMREHEYHMSDTQPGPVHGQKRRASDDLERQSAISTQFKKLRLNHAVPAQLPSRPVGVTIRTQNEPNQSTTNNQWHEHQAHIPPQSQNLPQPATNHHHNNTYKDDYEYMPIDDTPNRIIIHDLDAELASIEAEEKAQALEEEEEAARQTQQAQSSQTHAYKDKKGTISLPEELDKQISAIPQSVLKHQPHRIEDQLSNNTALVLYRDPTSLSVPEEEDAVRKAIVAARKRVRERQGWIHVDPNSNLNSSLHENGRTVDQNHGERGGGNMVNGYSYRHRDGSRDDEVDMDFEDDGRYNSPRQYEDEYDPDAMEIE